MTEDVSWLFGIGQVWAGLRRRSIVELHCTVSGKTRVECRYVINSCNIKPLEMARGIRAHWRIENGLHWVLDAEALRSVDTSVASDTRSVYNPLAMKKLFFVFVLLIFPFQMTWAVADSYCQNAQNTTRHLCTDCISQSDTVEDQKDKSSGFDLDCSNCGVFGAVIAGLDTILAFPSSNMTTRAFDPGFYFSIGNERPERPQWPFLSA